LFAWCRKKKPFVNGAAGQEQPAAETDKSPAYVPRIAFGKGFSFLLLLILCALAIIIFRPQTFAKTPAQISTSTIISTLNSQFTLNVLEDQAVASYQVSDPQLYELLLKLSGIPFP
jgi:hypothetical protein